MPIPVPASRLARFELRRFRGTMPKLALIFVLIVPALYGAIYLSANWDPYGRLGNLPVAVVNADRPDHVREPDDHGRRGLRHRAEAGCGVPVPRRRRDRGPARSPGRRLLPGDQRARRLLRQPGQRSGGRPAPGRGEALSRRRERLRGRQHHQQRAELDRPSGRRGRRGGVLQRGLRQPEQDPGRDGECPAGGGGAGQGADHGPSGRDRSCTPAPTRPSPGPTSWPPGRSPWPPG